MELTIKEWHQRFCQQARWTYQARGYLFKRAGLNDEARLLDVGCGTGAIIQEIENSTRPPHIFGLDIDRDNLSYAHNITRTPNLLQADAHAMPYTAASFDVACCHFLLLWVKDPRQVLSEMVRVIRSGGAVLTLAEPDYGGRIDYPAALTQLGTWQTEALHEMSADPLIGRKLRALFLESGLVELEIGVLGGLWDADNSNMDIALEQKILRFDLENYPVAETELNTLLEKDAQAWKARKRTLFIPTFYAFGRKP